MNESTGRLRQARLWSIQTISGLPVKGGGIGPLVQQFFRQGLHGQARSTAATRKMFPRLVHLQLEAGFILSLVISPAVTIGGGRGRIRPAQVLTLGAIEQVRVAKPVRPPAELIQPRAPLTMQPTCHLSILVKSR